MLTASIYIDGAEKGLALLGDRLGIPSANRLDFVHHQSDYGFYRRQEDAFFYTATTGDFDFAVDLTLFGWDRATLEAQLQVISQEALRIALPDESRDNPYDYLLFERGEARSISILDHEDESLEILEKSEG
ncbi:MAG: hypothetical protein AAGC60_20900 [Acidobacteriota bacterium]